MTERGDHATAQGLGVLDLPEHPRLVSNITHFARALRKAGLPIGPGRVIEAVRAVEAVGFSEKRDFYWTLHACLVSRREHSQVFSQVFRLFWRDPRYMEHMMALLLPAVRGAQQERAAEAAQKRAAEALLDGANVQVTPPGNAPDDAEIEIDATRTQSSDERLRTLDFEQMSTDEIARAKRMLARLNLPVKPLPSRRFMQGRAGSRVDFRRTLRQSMRQGGDLNRLVLKQARPRWPNLVVLCDISGSMSQYSRMILHFLHAISTQQGAGWARVHAFTFGTRLTNITRHLGHRDVDAALAAAGAEAQDWEGGTRIGQCLRSFNRAWSRRIMGQGAIVLLITDGLERDDPAALGRECERLHLSARRVIWLNPLLRWDGFAPRARGIAAILPHVDSFRAGHSIQSLEDLGEALSRRDDVGEKERMIRLLVQG
ncbi:VWA domain-containing protein [Pseudooceanicola sediminis]|uniref:VWA domain-containing protein n=1 Tax=Pseudooceanicola sediminis TaxID=2211117 RepID=A0A399J161_9RHOB|nr:VWA domain-containing protein [Pseudooceanicola sediminis]KAA2316131.1 VWA domain-containing protein [Puniceibacterium sp. HSS470]RII38269.1 VWA domain-containing protein [Pseudooceanicola sediminis]